jgi:hypothetical protein
MKTNHQGNKHKAPATNYSNLLLDSKTLINIFNEESDEDTNDRTKITTQINDAVDNLDSNQESIQQIFNQVSNSRNIQAIELILDKLIEKYRTVAGRKTYNQGKMTITQPNKSDIRQKISGVLGAINWTEKLKLKNKEDKSIVDWAIEKNHLQMLNHFKQEIKNQINVHFINSIKQKNYKSLLFLIQLIDKNNKTSVDKLVLVLPTIFEEVVEGVENETRGEELTELLSKALEINVYPPIDADVVKLLIEHGIPDYCIEFVKSLIIKWDSTNEISRNFQSKENIYPDHQTLLMRAVNSQNYQLVKLLIENLRAKNINMRIEYEYENKPDSFDHYCNSAFNLAVKNSDTRMVALFIESSNNKVITNFPLIKNYDQGNSPTFETTRPIIHACRKGNRGIVKLLLSENNVNEVDSKGSTALMIAVKFSELDIIPLLLEIKNIDVNKKNHNGLTALMIAAKRINEPSLGCNSVIPSKVLAELLNHPKIQITQNNNPYIPNALSTLIIRNIPGDLLSKPISHCKIKTANLLIDKGSELILEYDQSILNIAAYFTKDTFNKRAFLKTKWHVNTEARNINNRLLTDNGRLLLTSFTDQIKGKKRCIKDIKNDFKNKGKATKAISTGVLKNLFNENSYALQLPNAFTTELRINNEATEKGHYSQSAYGSSSNSSSSSGSVTSAQKKKKKPKEMRLINGSSTDKTNSRLRNFFVMFFKKIILQELYDMLITKHNDSPFFETIKNKDIDTYKSILSFIENIIKNKDDGYGAHELMYNLYISQLCIMVDRDHFTAKFYELKDLRLALYRNNKKEDLPAELCFNISRFLTYASMKKLSSLISHKGKLELLLKVPLSDNDNEKKYSLSPELVLDRNTNSNKKRKVVTHKPKTTTATTTRNQVNLLSNNKRNVMLYISSKNNLYKSSNNLESQDTILLSPGG